MKKGINIIGILLFSNLTFGQSVTLEQEEPALKLLLDDLRSAENNAQKKAKNDIFILKMKEVLALEGALSYNFTQLSTVGFIDSPDKKVRIVNWNVEQDDKSQRYYGFVIHRDDRRKQTNLTELVEDPFGVQQPEEVVEASKWYGALYYRIIPVKKGSRTVYTLLGWDGNTSLSNIKLIDAMYISGRTVKFGLPIFKVGASVKRRLFYEHAEKVTMFLNYEDDRQRIMMDHLSPESPTMKGFYSFYVPDLSYDALKFEKGKWVLYEDVIGVNKANQQDHQVVYTRDPKTGKLKAKEIDNKWENPEDPDNPGGQNAKHVAMTPEEAEGTTPKENKDIIRLPETNRKDNRDPTSLSIYGESRKIRRQNKKIQRQLRKEQRK